MGQPLRCCNDTYVRDRDGVWRYPWGDPVPGATDLTLADLMALDGGSGGSDLMDGFRPLNGDEREWLAGRDHDLAEVFVRHRTAGRRHAGDLIIGMMAPELHVVTMMTVGDVAEAAGVSKATIDSYRYRGYLPDPQVTQGRTPLWARPIVHHWLATRPGCGWRSDVYGRADIRRRTPVGSDGRGSSPAQPRQGFRVA